MALTPSTSPDVDMAMNSQGQLPLLVAAGLPSPFTAGGRAIPGRGHEAPGEGRPYVGWVTPGERLKRLALDKSGPKAKNFCTPGAPTKTICRCAGHLSLTRWRFCALFFLLPSFFLSGLFALPGSQRLLVELAQCG